MGSLAVHGKLQKRSMGVSYLQRDGEVLGTHSTLERRHAIPVAFTLRWPPFIYVL